jgi:ABC-2 type transport system permease protein
MKQENKQPLSVLFGINKTARIGAISATATLILLVVLVAVNALLGGLPTSILKPNVTGSDTFRVSGKTLDWLETLDEDVTLYFVCEGGKNNADGDLYAFLQRYEDASDRVHLEVVDPKAGDAFISTRGGVWPTNMSVIVESAARYRVIDQTDLYYYYFYEASSGTQMTMTPEQYVSAQQYFAEMDTTGAALSMFMSGTTAYFDGEARVTNAINYVTQDKVAVAYMLTGNGATALDAKLQNRLSQGCYDLRTTLSLAELPEDCDILVINAPTVDLSEAEAELLSSYLAGGGKLMLTTLYTAGKLTNLDGVLSSYGLSFEDSVGMIYEGNPNYYFSAGSTVAAYMYKAHIQSAHPATGDFTGAFVGAYAHAIKTADAKNVTVTPWLYTSEAAYLRVYDQTTKEWTSAEEKAAYTFGAIAEKGDTKILWISAPTALTEKCDAYAGGGNFELLHNALNAMSGIGADGITVASTAIENTALGVSVTQFAVWGIILVLLLPIAVAVVGVVIWYSRKKR